jgi:hypothetical protein
MVLTLNALGGKWRRLGCTAALDLSKSGFQYRRHLRYAANRKCTLNVLMQIPLEQNDYNTFYAEARAQFSIPSTHLYVDTSFLVWLVGLGKQARQEFNSWVNQFTPDRVHVPVWAAHEFLRHHVQQLIKKSLADTAKTLEDTAETTYSYIRPFLDEALSEDGRSAADVQAEARETLVRVKRLAGVLKNWDRSHYDAHIREVITFINTYSLSSDIFDYMYEVDFLEKNRFSGRMPPGFQDRRKKDTDEVGGNSFGDLIFWKEILDHTKEVNAKCILILSNDRKNDWHIGGQKSKETPTTLKALSKGLWPSAPTIHPTLEYEAKKCSNVDKVILIDSKYLAALLDNIPGFQQLIRTAVPSHLPSPQEFEKERRACLTAAAMRQGEAPLRSYTSTAPTDSAEVRRDVSAELKDGPNVAATEIFLDQAVGESLVNTTSFGHHLIDLSLLDEYTDECLNTFITSQMFFQASTEDLVSFARKLYLKAFSNEGRAPEVTQDLINTLDSLSPKTACCLYFGLLLGCYLNESQLPQIPPNFFLLDPLLHLQNKPFAKQAINVLSDRLQTSERYPIYVPSVSRPPIHVKVNTRSVMSRTTAIIVSLEFDGIQVLTDAQAEERYQLRAMFPQRDDATISDIVKAGCRVFGVPFEQISCEIPMEFEVGYGNITGFARPQDTYRTSDIVDDDEPFAEEQPIK